MLFLPRVFVRRNLLFSLGSVTCASAVGSLQQWLYFGSNKVLQCLNPLLQIYPLHVVVLIAIELLLKANVFL